LHPNLAPATQEEIAMRILLATALMSGFAAASAYAECGHSTTAQSKPPVIVAQNLTPPAAAPADAVNDTLTGSIEDEALIKKRLIVPTEVE
jgi:hypothetical protein